MNGPSSPTTSLHDHLKAGERRVATILFSDMKGFTGLSEKMDPEEMDTLMTRIFGLFEEIIRAQGGTVEKYIGDALVAVFGVPELHEDDAARAVNAALEFLARIREEVGGGDRKPALSFRTGIHTGLVTTGKRGEFDVVTGHAMSVAQRLEAAAPPDGILVSEETLERCRSDFEFSDPREIVAKGKTDVIRAFVVKGASTGELNDEGPFIGRREELELLLKAYLRNRYDEVSGFYLAGEAGIGKTRLAQALVDKIRLFPDFDTPVLAAKAQKHRPGSLAVIVDIILDSLLLPATATREEIEAALSREAGIDEGTRARFANLCCGAENEEADPHEVAVLYKVFTTVVERHARDLFPLLVVIDNAPFLDKLSRAFFRYWFHNGKIKPFFVLTGRDFPAELRKTFKGLELRKLEPLSAEAATALAKAHWPDAREEALAKILEASLGNPLFIKEYAVWARGHRDVSSLPASIQNIFLATLERYPVARRDLAKKLSVFAHSFTLADARRVEAATGGDPAGVAESLEAFVADGLLLPNGKGSWSFRADVFKKALYAALLNHNKRILHGIVADLMLEQDRPARVRLIGHLLRAGRDAEAAGVMQDDPGRTHNYEYLPLLETLLRRVSSDDEASFRLLVTKAALLFNRGRIEESEEVLRRIMRTAIARKSDLLMGYAYHHICAWSTVSFAFQKAVFTGQKALHHYLRAGATPLSVQNVLRYMALAHVQRAEPDEALRLIARSEAHPGGNPVEAAAARAEYHLLSGEYRKALETVGRSLEAIPEDGIAARFFNLDLRIKALWQLCDFASIVQPARELLSLGFRSESQLSQASAMLGYAFRFAGDREASADAFVQAGIYAAQVRSDFEKLDAWRTLALCLYLAGDARKAEETANEALTIGLRHSGWWPTFTLLVLLVESSFARGKSERARFYLAEASHFFTTGYLLPAKDQILYYWLAAKLQGSGPGCPDPEEARETAERNLAVAARLLEVEKTRLGEAALVEAFLGTRAFRKINDELLPKRPDGGELVGGRGAGERAGATVAGEGGS
jgi:class 3 adenylate cyclase/tetratricopeptide (TPR) repeat protein